MPSFSCHVACTGQTFTHGGFADDEPLADADVDAGYNPLPNHLHVPLTLHATRAGKHVLCEKAIALTAAEAEQLRQCPKDRIVLEAFMVRFHPQWLRVRDLVRSGAIGELRAVQVFFGYDNRDPDNIRHRTDTGGGALLDIGCYGIVSGRFCFETEPVRVVSMVERDPAFGTDRLSSVIADMGGGRQLVFTVSTQIADHQHVLLAGTRGRIEILIPFNAWGAYVLGILAGLGVAEPVRAFAGKVEQVVIADEEIHFDESRSGNAWLTEDLGSRWELISPADKARALRFAEEADWPAWEYP